MRLGGYVVGIAGFVACAQGVQSPGMDSADDNGGSSSALAGSVGLSGSFSASGSFSNVAGTSSHGGTTGASGAASTAGKGGASHGGSAGTAAGGSSAGGPSVGGGTGELGCSHPQPGDTGLTLSYMTMAATMSVPYVYFKVDVVNPDDNAIALSDLKLRYYFANDLTAPHTDFYSPQIKHTNGNTENLGANDVTATYTPTYLEIGITSAGMLMNKEHLSMEVHMNSNPVQNHDQSADYSFSAAATALTPLCKITVYQGTALTWGTPG